MNHPDLDPAYDLSVFSYFLDFFLVPMAVVGLLALTHVSVLAILTGIVLWTLAEYWIHRSVFHGNTRYEEMHELHHRHPKDMIGVSSWLTFAGFSAIGLLLGSGCVVGFMLGYLFYCGIHVRFHHHGRGAKLSPYVAYMNEHHTGHHRGGKGNFGVSTPGWDWAFGTLNKGNKS